MAFYANQIRESQIKIDGEDVTDRVISWTVSDSSAKFNAAVQTTGELVLGQAGSLDEILDYERKYYKRGTEVVTRIRKLDGSMVRHPRGLLFVLSTSYSPDGSEMTVELGCRLALANLTNDLSAFDPPVPLDPAQNDFASVSNSYTAASEYVYQDKTGSIESGRFFEGDTYGTVTEGVWLSVYGETAFSVTPLQAAGVIPDSLTLSYDVPLGSIADDQRGRKEKTKSTSNYFIQYPGTVYIREATSDAMPPSVNVTAPSPGYTNPCGNSPSQPGGGGPGDSDRAVSCSAGYTTTSTTITCPAKKVSISESTYDGPAGQISYAYSENRGPAIEVNSQYYSDSYQACRYNYATNCQPGGNCELEGLNTILQDYSETFYKYDEAGTLIERVTDNYKNILAAAQPFNWRAGNVNGQDQGFIPITQDGYYLERRQINTFFEEGNTRKEKIKTFTSIATNGSGIGNVSENATGVGSALNPPSQKPEINGNFANLPTETNGSGRNMVVDVIARGAGKVEKLTREEFEPQSTLYKKGTGAPMYGGTGAGLLVNYLYDYGSNFTYELAAPGEGYKDGDIVQSWPVGTSPPLNGLYFELRITKVSKTNMAVSIRLAGEGYAGGDRIIVTTDAFAQAAAASGQTVDLSGQPNLVTTVKSTQGVENLPVGGAATQFEVDGTPPSLITGTYRGLPTTTDGGGQGCQADVFVSGGGGVEKINGLDIPDDDTNLYSYNYVKRVNGFVCLGGSGTGLTVDLQWNEYTTTEFSGAPGYQFRTIDENGWHVYVGNPGSGYRNGDTVTIPWEEIAEAFNRDHLEENDATMKVAKSGGSGVEVFMSKGGSGYAKGDIITVSGSTLKSAGATNANSGGLRAKVVTAVSGLSGSDVSINAMNGIKTSQVNTSTTITSLPITPQTVNSPVTDTETVESVIVMRKGQYVSTYPEATTYNQRVSIPVPLLFEKKSKIKRFAKRYEDYLRSFTLGDALGLQIVESLRDEIVDNWRPGLSFRYYDPRTDQLLALRMDACTWGLTPTEAVFSVNGIFLGKSNGSVENLDNTVGAENLTVAPPTHGGGSGTIIIDGTTPPPPAPPPRVVPASETAINQGDYLRYVDQYEALEIQVSMQIIIGANQQEESYVQAVYPEQQLVVYVTGEVVEPGQLMAREANGSIPFSYNGSLLISGAVRLEDPFNNGTPQPVAVAGYFPLYATQDDAEQASPVGSAHEHILFSLSYWMPNGLEMGVSMHHGTYYPPSATSGGGTSLPPATSTPSSGSSGGSYGGGSSGSSGSSGGSTPAPLPAPTATITSNVSSLGVGEVAYVSINLSQDSTNLVESDLVVSGGTLSAFSGSASYYTATFTPTAESTTLGQVTVPAGSFTNSENTANAQSSAVLISVNTLTNPPPSGPTPPTTYTVTVQQVTIGGGYGNPGTAVRRYFINGSQTPILQMVGTNAVYRFDQSDNSNTGHPLRLSTTPNGTHSGGTEYLTGVTKVGTPGTAGAYTEITVEATTPDLFYYCQNHPNMGGQAQTP